MRRRRWLLVLTLILFGSIDILAQQATRSAEPAWRVRRAPDRERIVVMYGSATEPREGKPEGIARDFLAANASRFGLRRDLSDLKTVIDRTTLGGATVELQQMVGSLPVANGRVQVILDRANRIVQVTSSYMPFTSPPSQPTIPAEKVQAAAVEQYARITPDIRSKAEREGRTYPAAEISGLRIARLSDVLYATGEGVLRHAYVFDIQSQRPRDHKLLTLDAATGVVLEVRNLLKRVDKAKGRVFNPNPVNTLNDNTLVDGSTITEANPPYFDIELLNLDVPAGGPYELKGPFVRVTDIEAPANTPPSIATADFSSYRGGATFDDVMVAYHIDRMQRYIQLLGFIDVMNRQIAVDSDGENGDDNSHYDPSTPGLGPLVFGRGGVDDASDADVIAHEYGHAIQDNQTFGKYNGNQGDSMGEGFGDYWALTTFANETATNGHDLPCIMEWDAVGNCLRRADNNVTFDNYAPGGSIYTNSQIWSRTLYEIFKALGRTTADRLILQSHFNVPDLPTFKQGADAVMTADLQLYAGAHLAELCTVFVDRKIYANADCPTVPPLSGAQNTLVVLARFNDAGLPASPIGAADVTARITSINNYLAAVSYSQASLGAPVTKGWIDLGQNRAHYYEGTAQNLLVNLIDDIIPLVSGVNWSTIDRMIVITNDDGSGGETRGEKEWATTGPWPYKVPSAFANKLMSVSVHTFEHTDAQFNHAMGHHFSMVDLYPHEGVTLPRKFANGWSNMAQNAAETAFPNTNVFVWDKAAHPGWATNANITFMGRPAAATSQVFPLFRQEANTSSPIAIQLGTTNGVAARADERVSYYVEARRKTGSFDTNLPGEGVIVYYVNEYIGQGFGPVRVVDGTPGDNDLANAALGIGGTLNAVDGSGYKLEVLGPTGSEAFRIKVTYTPQVDNDVWINPHDPYWTSADIWIDSKACNGGLCNYDKEEGRVEVDRGDKAVSGEENRVYARVYNHGPGTAHNVRVDFYFSDPYHGIDGGALDPDTGGNIAFNKKASVIIDDLPPTETGVPVFVTWNPVTITNPQSVHACVKVKIAQVTGDTNDYNQASQENITEYDISSHSPYPPVESSFRVVNPYDHGILVLFRADHVPPDWTATIVPEKVWLPVGGDVLAKMTIQAPLTYPVCTSEKITARAFYASGDTLVELGGSTAQVNLTKSEELQVTTSYVPCRREHVATGKPCGAVQTKGCTIPPKPFQHITIRYEGLDGKPIYHDVMTDANGCFEDFLVNASPGIWKVGVTYPGDDCSGTTHDGPKNVFVPFDGGGLGGTSRGRFWYSLHLGMGFPFGEFRDDYRPGPSITADFEYPFSDRLSIEALLGFHYFHADHIDLPDEEITNFNLDLRAYFPIGSLTGYAQAGPGFYRLRSISSNKTGFNAGLGLSFGVLTNLKIETGADAHVVTSRSFVDAHIGLAWRF